MTELHFRGVDWPEVVDRLHAYACQLFIAAGVLDRPITGKGPGDLVQEALLRLLNPRDSGVAWDERRGKPATDSIVAFLTHVVRNDFIDARKLPRHTRTEQLSSKAGGGLKGVNPTYSAATEATSIEASRLDRRRTIEELIAFTQDDPRVQEYLRIQFNEDGYRGVKPQRAAELLGTTVDEIYNLKKRCMRHMRLYKDSKADIG